MSDSLLPIAGETPPSPAFEALIASRKAWLADVLRPWCLTADRRALRKAELDWTDIAGRIAPEKSLWAWAWGRFSDLVNEELNAIEETYPVEVVLKSGVTHAGYPDARESEHGQLVLMRREPATRQFVHEGPFSIDDVVSIRRVKSL